MSNSLWPHGLQLARLPCPLPSAGVHPNSWVLNRWCHPIISSSAILFSFCHQCFPASGSFPISFKFKCFIVRCAECLSFVWFLQPHGPLFYRQKYWSCHFLLQGIFPTQEWYSISSVFGIGRKIVYNWATWEAQSASLPFLKHELILI